MLITASITGFVTSVTMIGPLLVGIAGDLGVSVAQAGLLAAASAAPQALAAPFAGLLSDRVGRRPLIVFSLAGVGVLGLAAAAAPVFAALVAIRFAAGLVGSMAPVGLMASVGDLFPPERRSPAMGWFNMGFSFAAIAGVPLMAAVGGVLGWRWAFAASGAIMLALAGAVRLWFPEIAPLVPGTSLRASYRTVWGVRGLLNLLSANLMERSLFMMTTIYLPAFLMLSYQMSAVGVAPILSIVAAGAIGGNIAGGWAGDRFPKPAIFVVAQVVAGALGLVLFGLHPALAAAVILGAALALANAASRPAFLAYGSELAPTQRGALFGLIALSNQSGMVVGSIVGALVLGGGGPMGFAIAALGQGLLAAALALPLLRPRRLD